MLLCGRDAGRARSAPDNSAQWGLAKIRAVSVGDDGDVDGAAAGLGAVGFVVGERVRAAVAGIRGVGERAVADHVEGAVRRITESRRGQRAAAGGDVVGQQTLPGGMPGRWASAGVPTRDAAEDWAKDPAQAVRVKS